MSASPEPIPCEHDWRVNPLWMTASNPPMEVLTCALCGRETYRDTGAKPVSASPADWPKA